jgi:hypothetical protein
MLKTLCWQRPPTVVSSVLSVLIGGLYDLNLELNWSKCQALWRGGPLPAELWDFPIYDQGIRVLGTPLGTYL